MSIEFHSYIYIFHIQTSYEFILLEFTQMK